MTVFSEVERSFMAFGDIELTPEESNQIHKNLKDSILEEMNLEDNMKLAKENASKSITKSLSILSKTKYDVEVRWVK